MGSDKPLTEQWAKLSKGSGGRKGPHRNDPTPESERISEDSFGPSASDDGVPREFADTSSVNTETAEPSLTSWLARDKPGPSKDLGDLEFVCFVAI